MSKPSSRSRLAPGLLTAIASIELVAIALWAGGLTALGAIVAPTVFGHVPTPLAADAMTLVFRRFDRVAIACSAVALVAEAMLSAGGGRIRGLDILRTLLVVLAAALAIGQGAWLSPAIESLHRAGAVRGVGDAGMALHQTHKLAEASGKGQLLLLLVALFLVVEKVARRQSEPRTEAGSGPGSQPGSEPGTETAQDNAE